MVTVSTMLPTLNFYHSRGNKVIELPPLSSLTLLLPVHLLVQLLQLCTKTAEFTSVHPSTL